MLRRINGYVFQIKVMAKRDVQHQLFDRTAVTSDYFPNHNQTGSMLSMTGLNSNSVLVREQWLIMIAVLCFRWEKMCCVSLYQTQRSEMKL